MAMAMELLMPTGAELSGLDTLVKIREWAGMPEAVLDAILQDFGVDVTVSVCVIAALGPTRFAKRSGRSWS